MTRGKFLLSLGALLTAPFLPCVPAKTRCPTIRHGKKISQVDLRKLRRANLVMKQACDGMQETYRRWTRKLSAYL